MYLGDEAGASGSTELAAEQAYVDRAHACLEATRQRVRDFWERVTHGRGGTHAARFERDVLEHRVFQRLGQLELGGRSLCFGRIDTAADPPTDSTRHAVRDSTSDSTADPAGGPRSDPAGGSGPDPAGGESEGDETFYIGRIGVWDEDQTPVVCDWRAPVAEPFFRATGRSPLGLHRRRRFVSRGSRLLGLDDEYFTPQPARAETPAGATIDSADAAGGDAATAADRTSAVRAAVDRTSAGRAADARAGAAAPVGSETPVGAETPVTAETDGEQAPGGRVLQQALAAPRTGRLGDVTATIQAEQDDVIRAPLPGVLIVAGGPGTGKTVVALHRAAYLIYTHRFPLAGQGVLVIGPNPVFLTYVEQVLPALGEAGVQVATLGDLLDGTVTAGDDAEPVARTKGDARMVEVLRRAVRTRRRPLTQPLVLDYGLQRLRLTTEASATVVARAQRRSRTHNAGRRLVESATFEALANSVRRPPDPTDLAEALGDSLEVRRALDWMWPALTPAHLLHDLFGSRALLAAAAGDLLDDDEIDGLYRPRRAHAGDVVWTADDVPLLDEARVLLGRRRTQNAQSSQRAAQSARSAQHVQRVRRDERNYGHIVVDEAQDLSPMQLRMIGRRSLNGSLTLVGDLAQATSAWAHSSWQEVVELMAPAAPPRFAELTIGYRVPQPIMTFAAACLEGVMDDATPPRAARPGGQAPRVVQVPPPAEAAVPPPEGAAGLPDVAGSLGEAVVGSVRDAVAEVGAGNVAVICAGDQAEELSGALADADIEHGVATQRALGMQVSIVPARLAKGLEVDAAIVVEPHRITAESTSGMRLLYVALSRATRLLVVITSRDLPPPLQRAARHVLIGQDPD